MSEKRFVPVELAPKVEPHGGDELAPDSGNATVLFLDALAFLAERWKFILTTTLIAGVLAFGVTLLIPKVYTSVAYLGPMDEAYAKSNEALIQSAPVLDTAIGNLPQYRPGYTLEERRGNLGSPRASGDRGGTAESTQETLSLRRRRGHPGQKRVATPRGRW